MVVWRLAERVQIRLQRTTGKKSLACCVVRSIAVSTIMSKKKGKEVEAAPQLLGRVGTSLKCGIVGLPNVG